MGGLPLAPLSLAVGGLGPVPPSPLSNDDFGFYLQCDQMILHTNDTGSPCMFAPVQTVRVSDAM